MKKIMILSDHVEVNSGFGNQTKIISQGLKDAGYDVYHIGLAYHGNPKKIDGVTWLANGDTKFGEQAIPYWIEKIKPDVLITLLDMWMINYIFKLDLGKTKWISYFPLDSEIILPEWKHIIKEYPYPVVFSEFAKKLCEEETGVSPHWIPHCIDTEIFIPLEEKKKLKGRVVNGIQPNDFIILMVGRNQTRKMQPYLIKAFAKFAKDKPDTKLMLHMDLHDNQLGWNLNTIIDRYNLANKIIHTTPGDGYFYRLNISEPEMNALYNMADVHYNCGNEGFGIPAMESNAAGIPNITPGYTTGPELTNYGKCGYITKTASEPWIMPICAEWIFPDTDDLTKTFDYLYNHRDDIQKKGKLAREYAVSKYDKKVVIPMWVDYIETILNETKKVDYKTKEMGI